MKEIDQIMVLENIQEQYPEATKDIFEKAATMFTGAVFNGLVFDVKTKKLTCHNPFGQKVTMDFGMKSEHRLMPKDINYEEALRSLDTDE